MDKQRSHYTKEEEAKFIVRAKEFMARKPEASRARISIYAGVGISVLERLQEVGEFKLPKPKTKKQVRHINKNWGIG